MAVYELQGPDGTIYEVDAPSVEQALQAFQQFTPSQGPQRNDDGTYGQPPADMFLDPRTGGMTSRELLRNNVDASAVGSLAGGLMQGTGFGFGDEVQGLLGYLEGGSDMANLRREQARATLEAQRDQQTVASIGGELAGGIGSSLAAAPALGLNTATTLGGRALQGAGLGTIEGALFGAGNGEGAQDRLTGAATTGAFGGLLGAAAPYALAGIRGALDPVFGVVASMRSAANPYRASRAIDTALTRSGRSAPAVQAEIDAALAAGQQYTVADALGNSGQRMLSGVARAPGDARQEITEFLMNRQGDQGRRIAGALDEGFNAAGGNTGRTANQVRTGLDDARGAEANTLYTAARDQAGAVNLTPAVEQIDMLLNRNPILGESALTRSEIGQRLLRIRGQMQAGGSQLINFDETMNLKQDLGNQIARLRRSGEKVPPELAQVYGAMDKALEDASPAYRAANDTFRQRSGVIDAIDTGAAMTSPRARVADNLATYGNMTPAQQAAARAGYVDPLIGRIENAAPGVNNARPLLSQGAQAEIGAMARDPQGLADFIRREQTMFETSSTALGGSRTADNLSDIQDVSAIDTGLIANLLTGRWGQAAQQLGGTALNAATGRNTATRDQIAQLLLSQDVGAALAPSMHRATQNIAQDRIIEALARNLQRQIGG